MARVISWMVKGFITSSRIPLCPTVPPSTFSLKPVQRMTGMSGRTWAIASAQLEPRHPGHGLVGDHEVEGRGFFLKAVRAERPSAGQ